MQAMMIFFELFFEGILLHNTTVTPKSKIELSLHHIFYTQDERKIS